MADQAAGRKGILIGHGDDLIVDFGIQHIRHKARADALDLVRTCNALAQHRRGGRLHSYDLDIGVLALEVLAHAGNSAAGANASHKEINLTIGVLPDLRTGGLDVCLRIGRVHELAGDKGVGNLLCQLIRLGNGTFHALCALAQDQLCAVSLHQLAALHAHGLGHHDDDAVALGSGHSGQTNAGVAGGRLNDHGTGLQLAGGLGIVDHLLGNAILDRAGGVEVFQLGQNGGLQVGFLLDMGQLQQRSVANQLICGSVNLAHSKSPPSAGVGPGMLF